MFWVSSIQERATPDWMQIFTWVITKRILTGILAHCLHFHFRSSFLFSDFAAAPCSSSIIICFLFVVLAVPLCFHVLFYSLVILAVGCLCFQSLLQIEFPIDTVGNIGYYFIAFFHLTAVSVPLYLSLFF